MKKIKNMAGRRRRAAITAGIILPILSFCQNSLGDQQGYDQTFGTLTNLPALLSNNITSGYTGNVVPLRPYSGLGLQTIFQGSNLVTAPMTVFVWPSVDGTNVANVAPYAILSYPANGTNVVIGCTNWSHLQLKGIAALFLNVSNGTGDNLNLNTSLTNGATVYQGGVLFNRPNQ